MHLVHRILHQLLRARNFSLQTQSRPRAQRRQLNIDADQRLDDPVMQLAADLLSLLLLRGQYLARQSNQLLLHHLRFQKEQSVLFLSLPDRIDGNLQSLVRRGQFRRVLGTDFLKFPGMQREEALRVLQRPDPPVCVR